jgi:flagellar biosynthesis regulator FlbT
MPCLVWLQYLLIFLLWQALWTRATTPMRQVGFMCFMMWMMGNGIQIFSIIMTVSGLATPIMAVIKSGEGEATKM